jgi:hypothetical protein
MRLTESIFRLTSLAFLGLGVVGFQLFESERLLAQLQQLQTVTPPPAGNVDRNILGLLPPSDQDAVAGSTVPVLIPAEKEFSGELKLVFEEYYYAWSSTVSGVELSLEGSRLAYLNQDLRSAPASMKRMIRDIPGLVTISEHVWYASWQEFGTSYVLGLACVRALDDRCGSDSYILRAANSLRYVGGGTRTNEGEILPPRMMHGDAGGSKECSRIFPCKPPGTLVSGSGEGREDYKIYAAGIRFPTEKKPAYANSQMWGAGGEKGPSGGECAEANYSYPWWDNFCETRAGRPTPMCPTRTGHQGQDIRPLTCAKDTHAAVSAVAGKVTHVGKFTVYITAKDGTRFDYLHMGNVKVSVRQTVNSGDSLGMVSNVFDGTPTTIHLHFEIFQNVSGVGFMMVPPYMSLVKSYERLP